MRIGKPKRDRGFTYLWLLFVIAASAALAAAGLQRWQTVVEREREAEQMFRGQQIAAAIGRYRDATPGKTLPRSLDELLEDRRSGAVKRHLRRLYTDPGTGKADWELLTDRSGGITALRSRSQRPAWHLRDLGEPAGPGVWRQSDRIYSPAAAVATSATP
jgi:type II secretory pathway pseudopilin PulG